MEIQGGKKDNWKGEKIGLIVGKTLCSMKELGKRGTGPYGNGFRYKYEVQDST